MNQSSMWSRAKSRAVSFVLCLLMAGMVFPLAARAAESGNCGEQLTWTLSDGILQISGSGAMANYTDEQPAPWKNRAAAITKVSIGQGVTTVGSLAFLDCTELRQVSLPQGLSTIGARAFKNCARLAYVRIPSTLSELGEGAFENCSALQGILLPQGLTSIGDFAFYRCTSLTTITVPQSVRSFGLVVFAYCSSLVRAEFLFPMTRVPDWTFYGCTALRAVALPQTVTEAGEYAFENCDNLSGIYYDGTAGLLPPEKTGDDVTISPREDFPASGSTTEPITDDSSKSTTVSTSGNATITTTTETDYSYTVDGKDASLDEALSAAEDADVSVKSENKITISVTLENDAGWDDLADAIGKADAASEDTVTAEVQLPSSTVSGKDLAKIAGKDVTVTVVTPSGSTWQIDAADKRKKDFSDRDYDLDFSVDKLDKAPAKIESDTVYRVKFSDRLDFEATAAVGVKVGNARQYATLYKKGLFGVKNMQTVVVDADGRAWFSFDGVRRGEVYYVAIDSADADRANAVIPQNLYAEYGVDREHTLMGMDGNYYEVGERTSRWGITGGQFALYVGIAVAVIIAVVTIIMLMARRASRSRAKLAALAEQSMRADREEAPIDEEALRLEIMQEMLQERNHQKKESPDPAQTGNRKKERP